MENSLKKKLFGYSLFILNGIIGTPHASPLTIKIYILEVNLFYG